MSNILEEYLVKIGAQVDRNAFNGANQAILQLTRTLQNLGTTLKLGGLAALFAKITESIVGNIKSVADLDMEYQKLANSMWVTKNTAKTLKIAMETMGASEQDIAWIPELREQFFRLREEMNALATPQDAEGQLSWIRQIEYDIQSLQVKLKMLREWIVYYLIKYLKPYIEQFQKFIQWLNDKLGNNMPAIAKKIASGLAQIVSIAITAGKFLRDVWHFITGIGDHIPKTLHKVVIAFGVAGAAIMMSPFGLMLTAIGGALILLQDFYYYMEGKKSSKTLAPMWAWLLKDDNPIKRTLASIQEAIGGIITRLTELIQGVFNEETRKNLENAVVAIAKGVWNIFDGFVALIKKMTGNTSTVNSFWKSFAKGIRDAINDVLKLGQAIGTLLDATGDALHGEWKSAGRKLKKAFMSEANRMYGGLFGSSSSSVERAAALTEAQPDDLLGDTTGCTKFVKKALGADDEFMQEMGDNLWTPDWLERARASGRFVEGTDGMQAGDVVVLDTDGAGDGSHVVLYDGKGGYYGNSSSSINKFGTRGKPVHGSMSDWDGQIMGYIRTGSVLKNDGNAKGAGAGGGISVNPMSYAAQGVPQLTQSAYTPMAAGNSYNNTTSSYGNIIFYVNGAQNPTETANAIRNVFANPNGVLNANKARLGGVGV